MRFFSALLLSALCCCKAASTSSQELTPLEKKVHSEVGSPAILEKNKSATFALAYRAKGISVEYLVIRLSDLKAVVKGKIQGSVTWHGDMEIKVMQTPGMVKTNAKPADNVRLINLNNYIVHKK
jgi:hypothetical protein